MTNEQADRLIAALEQIAENIDAAGDNIADAIDAMSGVKHVYVRPGETRRVVGVGTPTKGSN